MAGKMFCTSHHARFLDSFHVCKGIADNLFLILPARAKPDDRVVRDIIDINYRRIVSVPPKTPALFPNGAAQFMYEGRVIQSAKRQLVWKPRDAMETHAHPIFRIHRDKQWDV